MSDAMQFTLSQEGCRIAWRRDGTTGAPPILFCNSIGTDHRLWDAQVFSLRDRFDIIRFDTRGHGQSDGPEGDYKMSSLALDALRVLDAAEVQVANICGISLGGVIAMRLALDWPDRVQHLILADTATRIGSADSWEQRRTKVLTDGMASIAEVSMARFFSAEFRKKSPATVKKFREVFVDSSPEGYAGCCAALRDADLTASIEHIVAPTLVIAGLKDISTEPRALQSLSSAIVHSQYAELDAAHLSNVELPEQFTKLVYEFLVDVGEHH